MRTRTVRRREQLHDFVRDGGGIPDNPAAAWHNQAALNASLHSLLPGDTLHIPQHTFHVMGGVEGVGLRDATIRVDGTLRFSPHTAAWPRYADRVTRRPGLAFWDAIGLTLTTSSSRIQGVLDGGGRAWWSVPGIGYLMHVEHRPRLLTVANSSGILIERLLLKDSPYWTTLFQNVDDLTVRHCGIVARRTDQLQNSLVDLTAFNTDGFDVAGRNVHIHDVQIWTQDDAIAVKDYIADDYDRSEERANHTPIAIASENMLFERVNASGLGLVIGSIGEGIVRNITFRDCYLRNTVKGLYLKFRRGRNHTGGHGLVSGVTYERIVLDAPAQWPIWVGPAQQADARNPCHANPCSLCWPMLPTAIAGAGCTGATTGVYEHITLRNVDIYSPRHSPGVLLADPRLPMTDVRFHNVRVHTECGAASPLAADAYSVAFSRLPAAVVPDVNVTLFYMMVSAGIVAVLLLCACIAARGSARARTTASAILAAVAALAVRIAAVSIGLRDDSRYYVCEGVARGVATGDTWPVPACLTDETTTRRRSARPPSCSAGALAGEPAQWVLLSGVLILAAVVCCRHGGTRRRTGPRHVRSASGAAERHVDSGRRGMLPLPPWWHSHSPLGGAARRAIGHVRSASGAPLLRGEQGNDSL